MLNNPWPTQVQAGEVENRRSLEGSVNLKPIEEIASYLDIARDDLLPYGKDKAKVEYRLTQQPARGKLVLVTAMSPSPAGEGKTTTSIGLCDALNAVGKKAVVALREPSMGPVFGMKGGGTGGGEAQLEPSASINLHFTGDFHAITSAHNLLAAVVDNHLHHGNQLGLDPRAVSHHRVLDVNDRALRGTVIGLGGRLGGVPRESRFDITAASEIMAILALASDQDDLRKRLGEMVVGFNFEGEPVRAKEFHVEGSLCVLLKEALLPNLVQTRHGSPALVHCGPFANIAHGTNSVMATRCALAHADLVIQEAGFGSDLGAEKFFNIFCRVADVAPSCVVLVVTTRGIRYHGGADPKKLSESNMEALEKGMVNPIAHAQLLKERGVPVLVAINEMDTDTREELNLVERSLRAAGFEAFRNRVYAEGPHGGIAMARKVAELAEKGGKTPSFDYDLGDTLRVKIERIVRNVYGGSELILTKKAEKQLAEFTTNGYGDAYICMAKNQYSFSDDPKALGRAKDFAFTVREARLAAGARFVIPISGEVMTMPGLPKVPNLQAIDVDSEGRAVLAKA